jgi:hypothetical protein
MYLYQNKLLPRSFDNLFLRTNQVHKYDTRNSYLYHIPFCRTKIRQFSVIYQAPKFFNSLRHVLYVEFWSRRMQLRQ